MEILYAHDDIETFLEHLEKKSFGRVMRMIELLGIEEYHLGMPYSKKIEKDLYELRILVNPSVRIFYTFHNDSVVLLHAIKKQRQKLSKKDIETARARWKVL